MFDSIFPGRLAIQQRVLPAYRVMFLDILASVCRDGLSVFAGEPLPSEHIETSNQLLAASFTLANNWHFAHPGSPLYYCWQSGLLRWLSDWAPDALIVEANPRYLSTRRAVHWMHQRGKPVLGWGLGAPLISGPFAAWRRGARKRFLNSLDGLIAYSQRGAEEYRALGFPAGRIFVATNSVSARPQKPPPQRLPVYSGQPAVLFVGRLQARKRVDNLLLACAALPASLQPRLWIVGDGPAAAEIREMADRVYPQTEFAGALHGADLDAFFNAADLFVLPGTGGLAVQQAMSYALPVIVAQGDGTQEDLVREENGWLVPPGNLDALTEALKSALADPARLRRLGEGSFRIVSKEVNLEAMAAVFIRALDSVSSFGAPQITGQA